MLRFPPISQCADLAMNIGVCVCVCTCFHKSVHVVVLLCGFTSCFFFRARLLQSLCEAAHWQETVPALLPEPA